MKQPPFLLISAAASLSACWCDAYTNTVSVDHSRYLKQPRSVGPRLPFRVEPLIDNSKGMSPERVVAEQEQRPKRPGNVRYSLGIGKNPPVSSTKTTRMPSSLASSVSSSSLPNESLYEACRFLMEHQAVREYPSPSSQKEDPIHSTVNTNNPSSGPNDIQYNRQSEDALIILDEMPRNHSDHHPLMTRNLRHHQGKPIIVAHTSKKLSVNTAWVEMMVHCERRKLAKRK